MGQHLLRTINLRGQERKKKMALYAGWVTEREARVESLAQDCQQFTTRFQELETRMEEASRVQQKTEKNNQKVLRKMDLIRQRENQELYERLVSLDALVNSELKDNISPERLQRINQVIAETKSSIKAASAAGDVRPEAPPEVPPLGSEDDREELADNGRGSGRFPPGSQ